MSWRKSDSFILPPKEKKKEKKLTGLEKIETDVLETEIIDGGVLLINNKNMMITSKELSIETERNSLLIPNRGPIKASSLSLMYSIVNLNQRKSIEIRIDNENEVHHFIFESREKIDPELNVKIQPYMNKNNTDYENLIKIHFYLDINPDVFVPFEIKLNNESLSIKLNSPHSSFSLVWLPSPSKRWNIAELGFKTTLLDK
jgi:hypothetical protein